MRAILSLVSTSISVEAIRFSVGISFGLEVNEGLWARNGPTLRLKKLLQRSNYFWKKTM